MPLFEPNNICTNHGETGICRNAIRPISALPGLCSDHRIHTVRGMRV